MQEAGMYVSRIPRRDSWLRIRGFDCALHEWGSAAAPSIVYLHGWADCAATLQFVVDSFSADWHVIAPDLRGFGDSRTSVSSYWFPDYLADLDGLLDAVSPEQPVRLVGHSMGGNIAGLYAGSMPERVSAFASLEGFGLPDSNPTEAPARYRDWLQSARAPSAFASYPDFGAFAGSIARRNPRLSPDRALFVAQCWGREDCGEVRLKADPLHRLPNPILYRRSEALACWRGIDAPSLLVAGAESAVLRRVDTAGASLTTAVPVPGARVQILEGSGHMLHFDAPRLLAGCLEAFLLQSL
jgi:pimeloyl-ACP methyl ester carboxylesterase